MHRPHVGSGGRYPVLRTVALIYMIAGVLTMIGGVIGAVWELVGAPATMRERISVAAWGLAGSFLATLILIGLAEVIKLFIDIEHNTRLAAGSAIATMPSTSHEGVSAAALPADGNPAGRLTWLEGEETAEGALVRGH